MQNETEKNKNSSLKQNKTEEESLNPLIEQMLGLDIQHNITIWERSKKIPLLMRNIYSHYNDGKVPLEDTIHIDIGQYVTRNIPFHMLVVGRTGRQKSRMIKNLIKGAHKAGYKILIIEPKSFEMYQMKYKGTGVRLALDDKNEKLPVSAYVPAGIYDHVRKRAPYCMNKVKFYSLDIASMDFREIWLSLGMNEKPADIIVESINKGITDLEKIKRIITSNPDLLVQTKSAAVSAIDNLVGSKVFDKRYKPLDLEKEWAKDNIVIANYFSRQGKFMNTDIGLLISQARDIGQREGKNVTKKLIIFDDAFYYAGLQALKLSQSNISYAIAEMGNCQYNYRKFGIDSVIIIQNLDTGSIMPTLVEGREDFLISRTGSSEILKNLIPYDAYQLAINTNDKVGAVLETDKKNWNYEWIYVNGNGEWNSGFPFDVTVGHV